MKNEPNKKKIADVLIAALKYFILAVMLVHCFTLLYPIFWMLINSFKDQYDYAFDIFGLPMVWEFSNYPNVLGLIQVPVRTEQGMAYVGLLTMTFNTVLRSVSIPVITVMFKACCAYCLAKYKFPGRDFIYKLGIVVMILPIVGALPSAMLIQKSLGTYDNLIANILISPNNIFGMDFLIIYSGFRALSWDYAEAAFIDGAKHDQVMFRIMLPMMLPLCFVYIILNFLANWNDYSVPLIWLPSYPTISYGIYYFQLTSQSGAEGTNTPMLFAGYTIVMVPCVILYLLCHKVIIAKLTVGGLKG